MEHDKREQILAGVWQVIATDGLAAVSVRSVATAAGVSPGRVQHYFATKTELVRASARAMIELAQRTHPETGGSPDQRATLEELLLHPLEPASSSRAGTSIYYAYIAASLADPEIGHILAEAHQGLVSAVRDCLATQHPDLPDPVATARRLVLLSNGATQAVLLGSLDADLARELVRAALPTHPGNQEA
ncbi:TetR/AcrR family transcriptional regulator [Luteococcus peritonei]|uniref:TetR/AcrR family transcriptional regulator n=1 Tax=Luteococcus peritonei TaxID=88874 RepID=A0ABW4RRN8_9ACTN